MAAKALPRSSLPTTSRSGGKSTTRKMVPRAGGSRTTGRAAASADPALAAGARSVTQRLMRARPGMPSSSRTWGDGPSMMMTDLPWASCPVTTRRMGRLIGGASLLQPHVFDGRRPRVRIDQHQSGLRHLGADPARPDVIVDGSEPHPLVKQALDLVERRLALLAVGLPGLLLEERVDVGVAAVGEGAVTRHCLRHPRRGVAVNRVDADADPTQLLRGQRRIEGSALHGPDPRLDAHRREVSAYRLPHREVRRPG